MAGGRTAIRTQPASRPGKVSARRTAIPWCRSAARARVSSRARTNGADETTYSMPRARSARSRSPRHRTMFAVRSAASATAWLPEHATVAAIRPPHAPTQPSAPDPGSRSRGASGHCWEPRPAAEASQFGGHVVESGLHLDQSEAGCSAPLVVAFPVTLSPSYVLGSLFSRLSLPPRLLCLPQLKAQVTMTGGPARCHCPITSTAASVSARPRDHRDGVRPGPWATTARPDDELCIEGLATMTSTTAAVCITAAEAVMFHP